MNMKKKAKLFALILAVTMTLSIIPAAAADTAFSDLSASWAGDKIETMQQKGVYDGMLLQDETLFQPMQPITRAEFLLMLFNGMGLDLKARDESLTAPFTDYAQAPAAYQPYLVEGYNRGVMLGKPHADGTLYADWNAPLTRQEAVTIIGQILNARSDDSLTFTDKDKIAVWARDYLAALVDKDIIGGMPDGSFAPQRNLKRDEASSIVYELMERKLFVPSEIRVYAGSTDLGIKDGERLSASFGIPFGMTVGNDKTLLLADKEANTLRRINSTTVSLLAGQITNIDINGFPENGCKDTVSALEIMMAGPRYICQGTDGVIYYTDGGNNLVRMIALDGRGYTLSGNAKEGYVEGAREKAQFSLPSGLAIDSSGTIYVADTMNNCIRTITRTGETALYAGVPGADGGYKDGALKQAQFCQPTDLHFGSDGALYVADTGNSMIRVIRGETVSTLAGAPTQREELSGAMAGGYKDGASSEALFCGPLGLFVTADGIVLVADTENNVIRKIEDGFVTTVAGNLKAGNSTGPTLVSMLNSPADVVSLNSMIYVSDSNNHCIKVFNIGL